MHCHAVREATEALGIARSVGYRILEGEALLALAQAYVAAGREDEAQRCDGEATAIHRRNTASPQVRETVGVSRQLVMARLVTVGRDEAA
ncbi:hypothetical protein ACPFP2_06240 [Micromonospora citrea]|uniref:hypothetical protein n=1 Tax=Micromonospora citrea TaxID=47855 RepID=UPI003C5960FB